MELTGKCKEEFEKWQHDCDWFQNINIYNENYTNLEIFNTLEDSMKYGVLVDYLDSVGLNILITVEYDYGYIISENRYQEIEEVKRWYETRPEARIEAIKKANELRNEQLSNE